MLQTPPNANLGPRGCALSMASTPSALTDYALPLGPWLEAATERSSLRPAPIYSRARAYIHGNPIDT